MPLAVGLSKLDTYADRPSGVNAMEVGAVPAATVGGDLGVTVPSAPRLYCEIAAGPKKESFESAT